MLEVQQVLVRRMGQVQQRQQELSQDVLGLRSNVADNDSLVRSLVEEHNNGHKVHKELVQVQYMG